MGPEEDIQKLVPIALRGLADLLDTTEERLPAGISGLLANFGEACAAARLKSLEEPQVEVYNDLSTVPAPPKRIGGTNPSFPPPTKVPSIFTRPTRRPPKINKLGPKLPPPPRLPRGLKDEK